MRRDRTNAARQQRWRERQKLQSADTVMQQSVTTPASVTTPLLSRQRTGLVPFVVALAALAVAAVSGSFSVIGLTAVFTGAFWPVVGMGAALECAKLSAVAWLGRRYEASRLLKASVTALVITLMGLSAIGSYGFLAKAHLERVAVNEAVVASHAAEIGARKQVAQAAVDDVDKRIAQLDAAVNEATKRGRTSGAMALVEHETVRRNDLVAQSAKAGDALAAVQVQEAGIGNERAELATDYGPVRYLAALTGMDQDKIMQWFIALVAALIDPIAVILLLAASATADP